MVFDLVPARYRDGVNDRSGPVAKDAILNVLGDNVIGVDLLIEQLVEKGITPLRGCYSAAR